MPTSVDVTLLVMEKIGSRSVGSTLP